MISEDFKRRLTVYASMAGHLDWINARKLMTSLRQPYSLMSDYEVTLVNDNMQEFYVRFLGPAESAQYFNNYDDFSHIHVVWAWCGAIRMRIAEYLHST